MNINEFIYKLNNPQVYTGREINAVRKTVTGDFVNVCLVFPDKYEIGMSHYGLLILYHLLNGMENVNAERCFLPGRDSIEAFKQHGVPLFSLESKTPLSKFHIVAFSLLSEMNYTNVPQVLDLAGIPLRSRERTGTFPIIAAGGISAVNPEPLRDFIDIFGAGDGEGLFPDIVAAVRPARQNKQSRGDLLKRLEEIDGIYVPSLHPPVKKGKFYSPDLPAGAVKKRVLKTFENYPEPDRTIVPIGSVIFNRLNVEIARGCPQNCRFCQAKSYYAPYRSRPLENNIHHITEGLRETGFNSFSLSTLSAGDYPYLNELLELIPEVIAPGTAVSFSSLRPSTLSHHILSTVALFKRTGITIVAEAGTQRLRGVINKNVDDDEIFQAVELALHNKWQKIKLYFMLGLPTETMADIDGIVQLVRAVMGMVRKARQKVKLNVSFSSFVPKPQTPLQWAAREPLEETWEKIRYIKAELGNISGKTLHLDFHSPKNGIVETVMARGDYRVGKLIETAFKQGEIFSAWDSDFDYAQWEKLIFGSEYEEFLAEIPLDQPLPWDFLEVNFKKDYLLEEYKKALEATPTPACHQMECSDCDGCIYKMKRIDAVDEAARKRTVEKLKREVAHHKPKPEDSIVYRTIRLFYEKTGDFVFFSQLTMLQYVERLIRKAGIPFKRSKGFTPRMKISSLPALPVFAAGLEEVVELFVDDSFSEAQILELLNKNAGSDGFAFKKAVLSGSSRPLSKDIHHIGFEIVVKNLDGYIDAIAALLGETDAMDRDGDRLILTMDYSRQGQERFAAIYKIIDPDKKNTMNLTRTHVTFKDQAS
jgi:radical SAM family uncharacterized protein